MKEIPLTQGYVALVDDADYAELSQYAWQYCHGYASRKTPRINGGRRTVMMHRQIMGEPSGLEVDHWDHVGTHNWRKNLRVCTHQQNGQNVKRRATSLYKGVTWYAKCNKWRVTIGIGGQNKHLGLFADAVAGAIKYDAAARELFGEFAALNFPDGA